jgi:TonB family protein
MTGTLHETDVYSPREIARAAWVPQADVVAALGDRTALVAHDEAVRLGRTLARAATAALAAAPAEGAANRTDGPVSRTSALAVSGTLHAGVLASSILISTFGLAPAAATGREVAPADRTRLVFLALAGPGGGGGGGGLRQPTPPPKARREGPRRTISSPLPVRQPPPLEPPRSEPELPPLDAEPLPRVVAPLATIPADDRTTAGTLDEAPSDRDSRGPGDGGGVGTGAGTGLGEGSGAGVGPGAGGGMGGGPYRPGSGIAAPRLLREVRADYTDEARRRGLEGEVVLEIIVQRNGSVGDVTIKRRLGSGLDERAVQAVRQWRFAPATLRGAPIDVVVEVAVEFRLR